MLIKKILKLIFFTLFITAVTFFLGYRIAFVTIPDKSSKSQLKPLIKKEASSKSDRVAVATNQNEPGDDVKLPEPGSIYTPVNSQTEEPITSAPGQADEKFYNKMVNKVELAQSKAVFLSLMDAYDKKFKELYNMIDQMARMNQALQERTAQGDSASSIEESLVEEARYRNSLQAQIQAQQQLILIYNKALIECKGYITYLESKNSK